MSDVDNYRKAMWSSFEEKKTEIESRMRMDAKGYADSAGESVSYLESYQYNKKLLEEVEVLQYSLNTVFSSGDWKEEK